jgi:hypothetical protein
VFPDFIFAKYIHCCYHYTFLSPLSPPKKNSLIGPMSCYGPEIGKWAEEQMSHASETIAKGNWNFLPQRLLSRERVFEEYGWVWCAEGLGVDVG